MPVVPIFNHLAAPVPSVHSIPLVPWMTTITPRGNFQRIFSGKYIPAAGSLIIRERLHIRAPAIDVEVQPSSSSSSRGGTQHMSTAAVIGMVAGSLGIFIVFTVFILRKAYRRLNLNHPSLPVYTNRAATTVQGWKKPRLRVVTDEQFKLLVSLPARRDTVMSRSDEQHAELDVCPICLADMEDDEKLLQLPCSHKYHQDCVRTWLTEKSERCPLCKKSVLDALVIAAIDPAGISPSTVQPPPRAVIPLQ